MKLRFFVADDHKIIRDGLRVLIEKSGNHQVIGEASDGRTMVTQVLALNPEVVVTDMAMTELNGIDATSQLRAAGFKGIILMLSMHDERHVVARALGAGVNGYIHKDDAFGEIVEAIESARRREIWLSPRLKAMMEGRKLPSLDDLLTPREREVLQLIAEGRGTKEIASDLGLSPKTVEVHRLNLFSKLRVNNVIDLTRIALKEKLVQL
ncbi:MAG TPA: response regulator transcription factor [Opitutaceae bacterium]